MTIFHEAVEYHRNTSIIKWNDSGDHLGHITDCDHGGKIVVNGEDCAPLAKRIVGSLNTTSYTAHLVFYNEELGFVNDTKIAFQDDGDEQAVLDSVFRFWRNLQDKEPRMFTRLKVVRIYHTLNPQKIDADGNIPDNLLYAFEWNSEA